ncbi:MFS transporter [Nocardia colli]|uniref:MFS transporter n=1 Tax=Nocardia colli TaxID=2545717 RepID=A0A5N0E5C3_9NOCA|nr:MFS transporter [Nocardia colli]KAA8884183.1 MFS transporter [Nocardia colli]
MRPERIAWAGLAAMTVSFGLNFTMGVFFAPTAADYGIDAAAMTVAATLGTTVTGLAQHPIGRLLDRVGAKAVLVGGLTLISSSYLVLSVVDRTWEFIAAYMLLGGLGFAASSTLTVTTLLGRVHGDQAGPALSRAALGINLGQLITPWAATTLFDPIGVRPTYALLGAAGLAVTVFLALRLPTCPGTGRPAGGADSLAGRGKLLVVFGLHAATLYVVILMLPEHATELGWSVTDAGRLVALAALSAGLSSAAMARLLRRHSPESLLCALYLVRVLALVLATFVPGAGALVATAVLFGAASFPIVPLTMAVMSRGLDPARMGRTLAPAWITHQLAAAAGLGAATVIHAQTDSYRGYFALGVLFSLACLALSTPSRTPRAELVPAQ